MKEVISLLKLTKKDTLACNLTFISTWPLSNLFHISFCFRINCSWVRKRKAFNGVSTKPGIRQLANTSFLMLLDRRHSQDHADPTWMWRNSTSLGTTTVLRQGFGYNLIPDRSAWCPASRNPHPWILEPWKMSNPSGVLFHPSDSILLMHLYTTMEVWGSFADAFVKWLPRRRKIDALKFILQQKRFQVKLQCRLLYGNACRMQSTEANWKV